MSQQEQDSSNEVDQHDVFYHNPSKEFDRHYVFFHYMPMLLQADSYEVPNRDWILKATSMASVNAWVDQLDDPSYMAMMKQDLNRMVKLGQKFNLPGTFLNYNVGDSGWQMLEKVKHNYHLLSEWLYQQWQDLRQTMIDRGVPVIEYCSAVPSTALKGFRQYDVHLRKNALRLAKSVSGFVTLTYTFVPNSLPAPCSVEGFGEMAWEDLLDWVEIKSNLMFAGSIKDVMLVANRNNEIQEMSPIQDDIAFVNDEGWR